MNRASQYFSSLAELATDTGLIGQILQGYPAEILRGADKWAMQNSDYAEKHKNTERLPSPDPWQFLLDAPAVPKKEKSVFRAAQSQLPALRHLIRMAEGIATLNTDWYQKSIAARARGDDAEYNRAISKVADGHVIHARVQEAVEKQNDPELLKQMEWFSKKRRAQLVHRGKRSEVRQPKQWPSWSEFRKQNGLPVVLVEWWVRCGANGAPGLMFWRNKALTKFLKLHLDQSNLDSRAVKKIRQQLGLAPVGDKEHFVWDVTIKTKREGTHEIIGFWRNGRQSFRGLVHPQKHISPATLLSAI
jgi:hypothetical protein